jgi:hypothetical protein
MAEPKLNPQKPGLSQPQPHPKQGEPLPSKPGEKGSDALQPKADQDDKSKQVPIEGE